MAQPLSASDVLVAGGAGSAQSAAVAVVGRVDLLGLGSEPPPTFARLITAPGGVSLMDTVKVMLVLAPAASDVVRLQVMPCPDTVQVKLFMLNGELPE